MCLSLTDASQTWSLWRLWWRVSTGSCWCAAVAERSSPYIHKVDRGSTGRNSVYYFFPEQSRASWKPSGLIAASRPAAFIRRQRLYDLLKKRLNVKHIWKRRDNPKRHFNLCSVTVSSFSFICSFNASFMSVYCASFACGSGSFALVFQEVEGACEWCDRFSFAM